MKLPYWNKAIAWMEWRQNWWKFWAAFVLMSMTPIVSTIFLFIKAINLEVYLGLGAYNSANLWSDPISKMVAGDFGQSSMGIFAVFIVLALGVVPIAQERAQNSLEFLVATPVSRREIAVTKFLVGAGAIIGIMVVNLLFIIAMALVLPANYTTPVVLTWFAVTTSVLLALYSLGFLLSTITGNLPAAFLGAFGLAFAPKYVTVLLKELLISFEITPWGYGAVHRVLESLGDLLTLPYYIKYYKYVKFHVPYLFNAVDQSWHTI